MAKATQFRLLLLLKSAEAKRGRSFLSKKASPDGNIPTLYTKQNPQQTIDESQSLGMHLYARLKGRMG
jgi:hypothetical protein